MISMPVPRIMSCAAGVIPLAGIPSHGLEYLLDRGAQCDEDGTADDGMPDVEFNQVRHEVKQLEISNGQSVPGVDLQPQLMRPFRRRRQPFDLPLPFLFDVVMLGE